MLNKVNSLISIDPGSTKIGLALFKNEKLVKSEQITLHGESFYARLRALKRAVARFFSESGIFGYLAIETPYIGRNPQSGLKIGQARGIVLGLAFNYDVKIIDISPQETRSYYGVKCNAKKEVYQKLVRLENNTKKFGEDEADAIAIGATAINKIKKARLYNLSRK
jgi:crossover junction endodeoxyribonuclease RuvC